jgi:hypothetical protein
VYLVASLHFLCVPWCDHFHKYMSFTISFAVCTSGMGVLGSVCLFGGRGEGFLFSRFMYY